LKSSKSISHLYRRLILSGWLAIGLALATQYNACSPAKFEQSPNVPPPPAQKSTAVILINQDALYTNSLQAQVQLESPQADEVYVTNVPGCGSGGNWEPLVAQRSWMLIKRNQKDSVYAQFRNLQEGVTSDCVSDEIIEDDEPPTVILQQAKIVTNQTTPIISFLASDSLSGLDKMICEWPGMPATMCSFATSNGNLAEGRYLVKIHATDKAGNASVPVTSDVMVDRTGPVITLLSVPPLVGSSTTPQFSFNITDDRSGVSSALCAFDKSANLVDCANSFTGTLVEGPHVFIVHGFDNAGNMTEVTYDFTIDRSAPTVTITSYPPDYNRSPSGTFEFTGMDGAVVISKFDCSLDAGTYTSCTSPKTYTGLTEGVHTFEVIGYDAAGNKSAPASHSWFVDTTAPVITFVATPDPLTNKTSSVIKYAITDAGTGVAKSECSVDNAAYVLRFRA
jgi:hypothetical protein